jgi:hypothetical protein
MEDEETMEEQQEETMQIDEAQEEAAVEAEAEAEAEVEEPVAATPKPRGGKKVSRSSSSFAAPAFVDEDDATEDTPTRLTRLDEKSELQGLNKRLEFYILKQRERDASADAWGRELANLKNKHAADLEHQKNLFENQLGLVRKNRDELSAKLSKLEGENAQSESSTRTCQPPEW